MEFSSPPVAASLSQLISLCNMLGQGEFEPKFKILTKIKIKDITEMRRQYSGLQHQLADVNQRLISAIILFLFDHKFRANFRYTK